MKHELKTWPCYFEAVVSGDKNFEIRNNKDRGFQKGDEIVLKEFDPNACFLNRFTGRECKRIITYVTNYEQKEDFVVFGMKEASNG